MEHHSTSQTSAVGHVHASSTNNVFEVALVRATTKIHYYLKNLWFYRPASSRTCLATMTTLTSSGPHVRLLLELCALPVSDRNRELRAPPPTLPKFQGLSVCVSRMCDRPTSSRVSSRPLWHPLRFTVAVSVAGAVAALCAWLCA